MSGVGQRCGLGGGRLSHLPPRALYAHRRKVRGTARGELLFEKGAVFRVLDTLPLGHLGMWRAERIGQRGETVEVGLIPTQLS